MAHLALIPLLLALAAAPAPGASAPAASAPAVSAPAAPDPDSPAAKPTAHFASLRAEKVNLRTGPSADYPIEWVFVRKGLPVEILASFDTWRKIRASDGTVGWAHQGRLSGRRSVLVTGQVRALRRDPKPDAEIVAQLEPGVIGRVSRCGPEWCEVKVGGYRGWVGRAELWGLEPDETIQ